MTDRFCLVWDMASKNEQQAHDEWQVMVQRIAEREAECGRIKAYNASCRERKAAGDMSLLSEAQRKDLLTIARVCSFQLGKYGEFPGYALTNIRGRITNDRKRLDALLEAATG
ncbi:MAG TPA: hypothetical protein DCP69_04170 [Candidatus Omnitrophica bacterium]|nr:hypothetical protein [Candidatus Omnitrophota bacterium]